jgi:hypothetical protein
MNRKSVALIVVLGFVCVFDSGCAPLLRGIREFIKPIFYVPADFAGDESYTQICNGSFEKGEFDTNLPTDLCGGDTRLEKWQVLHQGIPAGPQSCQNAKDAIGVLPTGFHQNDNFKNIDARESEFFVDLTGSNSRAPTQYGEVLQTVGTQPGQEYFWRRLCRTR